MTADDLQRAVLTLANRYPTRYWLHWNYPVVSPWVMSVRVWPTYADPGVPESLVLELERLEFEWDEVDRQFYANRTDEGGNPYQG